MNLTNVPTNVLSISLATPEQPTGGGVDHFCVTSTICLDLLKGAYVEEEVISRLI